MRISRVIGKVTLNRQIPELKPGSYLLVRPCNRGTLAGKNDGGEETLVMYDNLAAREGDLVGLVEGREATAPFFPDKVPYDCYNACILEAVDFRPILPV
jgi:carbon dioxide concentrating mechanism protein CcmL